eukprot:gene47213-63986_t
MTHANRTLGEQRMNAKNRQPARDPQDLERLLIDRQHEGDIEGMTALFEPDA